MQAQARRQQTQTACTAATSTRLLKSLINTSIASILFSRLLLPEECFTSADMSAEVGSDSHGRPLAIRALRTSYSSEVDRILEVTKGAFEALERGYLRKLIFAIYLDESDPTNVLESYTFDISYDRVEGSGERHPVLSIVDQFQKVDLNKAGGDPCVKTVADLKRAVKNLVQHLVSSMDIANELPRSCYVGFQLYYTDDTPVEYEPPCFSAGDAEANKYHLNTHSESERPVTYSSQPLRTGYHSIGIRTASVAAFLHGRLKSTSGNKTVADEEDVLRREKDIHLEDARTRTTSWDVDSITREDSTGGASANHANTVSMERRGSGMDIDVQYGGRYTPHKRIGSLLRSPAIADDTYTATQVVGTQSPALQHTQVVEDSPVPPRRSRRSAMRDNTETVDTMALTDLLLERQARDSLQGIDVNTQDFIGPPKGRHSKEAEHAKCYCGLTATEDGLIRCDGPCGQTFHVWCLGFHTNDLRLHGEIKCFDCCIAEDPNAVLLTRPDVLANARLEFTDLVLFRRALQVIKLYQPGNWTAFKKHMHSAGNAAKPAWTRLEAEGFIALENPGAGDTDNALKKANKKQTKPSVKKKNPKHVLTAKVVGAEFDRYFSGTVDYKLLQLDESRLFPPAQVFNADSDEVASSPGLPLYLSSEARISGGN
ncbi:hypothetical protein EXIGLDRAFT_830601 [Exidia glandulosa HHB12029]|uniref:HORMA domain-containing protein n=1 Tax=Exidia glandulosa HHB12029 TaxID=1314781 RepID=A0A165NGI3_EXIGL|nr:hypothetical protein EXIGLDRAFT_830601 [Exidia glandulosa HHB12029]